MKISFGILALSVAVSLVTVIAQLGRLRWHLRRSRSGDAPQSPAPGIEPIEKTNQN